MRLPLIALIVLLTTGCIQEAQWTWTGDTPGDAAVDGVTGDGRGEVSPSDVPGGEDTDVPAPKDTTDTFDTPDICVPNCTGKECGDDGCGGSCGICGDDDPCNGNEPCEEGKCYYDSPPDCDDDNPCTTDSCVEGEGCLNDPVTDTAEPGCDDGNPCTGNVCVSGECKNPLKDLEELVVEDCLCESDEDCEPLEDGNYCNGTLVCDLEADTPTCMIDEETIVTCALPEGAAPECNVPVCVPETGDCGVGYANEDGPCEDGNACTSGELCKDGECKNGDTVTCGDDNPCTDDSCNPVTGCVNTPNTDSCDDENDCTNTDLCSDGTCAGTGYECNQPEQCETAEGATCNGDGTCTYPTAPMDGTPCDDGDLCSDNDQCQGGQCLPGMSLMCDPNPCADVVCDPAQGCVYTNIEGACDDDDPCTTEDHCDGGVCVSGGFLDCDDGNDCTDDDCISGVGCDHVPGNEGEFCNAGAGTCVSGECLDLSGCGDGDCGGTESCSSCPEDCGCDPDLEECTETVTGEGACVAKMVEIPAGNFWMGCNNCEGSEVVDTDCNQDEHSYHEVYLSAYEMGKTEVTNAQYASFMNLSATDNACGDDECLDAEDSDLEIEEVGGIWFVVAQQNNNPVIEVTWFGGKAYCQWIGKDLCTEAKWEKGARGSCAHNGGTASCKAATRKYPWGNATPSCYYAVMGDDGPGCGTDGTMSVCSKSPEGDSPYGLCDMAGNR